MFCNREKELRVLEGLHDSGRAEFFVLYGRRRVGKTELLRHFCAGRRHFSYLASQLTEGDQLRQVTDLLRHAFSDPLLEGITFQSWEAVLLYLAQRAGAERLVVILDEFPYLCDQNPALPSLVQRFWDQEGQRSGLFLILCGSQISFMEQELLGQRSPLYGRRTGQLQLQPFSYRESTLFFPGVGPEDQLLYYGLLGGMPAYLACFEPDRPLRENVLRHFLQPSGFLYDEVNFLLRLELRDPTTYASILHALAHGATRQSEIAQRIGVPVSGVSKYLQVLRDLQLVSREVSITERAPEKGRKGRYRLADPYLQFWYRFVQPFRSLLQDGQGEWVYDRLIVPHLNEHLGPIFEDMAHQYLRLVGPERYGVVPLRIGRHWEGDLEIDVVSENMDGSHWIGECKWWEEEVGENVFADLQRKAQRLSGRFRTQPRWILFARRGFTAGLRERARQEGITLVTAADMVA